MIEYKKLNYIALAFTIMGVIFFIFAMLLPPEIGVLGTWPNRYSNPLRIIGIIFIVMSMIVYYKAMKYPEKLKKIYMAKKDNRNKFLIIAIAIIAIIVVAFIAYFTAERMAQTQVLTLKSDAIRTFNVYWLPGSVSLIKYPEGEIRKEVNWGTLCQLCKEYHNLYCQGSMAKFDIILDLPPEYSDIGVGCKVIYNGTTYPSGGYSFPIKKEEYGYAPEVNFDFTENNQITLCCGIENYKEACKTATLSAKCT